MGERIYSLDTLKGIALLLVFFLHARWTYVGGPLPEKTLGFLLMTASRLAVPLFFLTSGYLLYMKLDSLDAVKGREYTRKFLEKIGKSYIIATALFFGLKVGVLAINQFLELPVITEWVSIEYGLKGIILNLLYLGNLGGGHLWFLPALFYSILLIYIARRHDWFNKLFAMAVILHIVGILSRTYLVLDQIPVPRNDMLFFGLMLTSTGYLVNREDFLSSVKNRKLLFAAVLFNILHIIERVALSFEYGIYDPYFWANYSFLTAPAALSIFMYFLRRKDLGKNSRFNTYGQNTLWIYILHPAALGIVVGGISMIGQSIGVTLMNSMTLTIAVTVAVYFGTAELVLRPWHEAIDNFRELVSRSLSARGKT